MKLKIEPGNDLAHVAAVREAWPELALQVDANGAYTLEDAPHLARLDAFGLLLVEQPLASDDLLGHAALARRMATPLCLDESIVSVDSARTALHLGACSVVNLKPGRVGGYLEAVRIHDLCGEAGAGLWCGGMLETGIGRAANVALAVAAQLHAPGRPLGVVAVLHDRRDPTSRAGRRLPAGAGRAGHRGRGRPRRRSMPSRSATTS